MLTAACCCIWVISNILAVEVGPEAAYISVQSGMRLARLCGSAIQAFPGGEFTIAGGTCPAVGVTGHVLCGGFGYFGREIGMASGQLVEVQYTNAAGGLLVSNATTYSDTSWAMRCHSGTYAVTHLALLGIDGNHYLKPPKK